MKPFRTSWMQFQGDSDNSGYAAVRTGDFTRERWRRAVTSVGGGSPVIDPFDDSIYLTDAVGQVSKYRALNGEPLWTRLAGNSVQWGSTPAIDNAGRVYAVFSNLLDSLLVCHDRDGNELWRYTIPGPSDEEHRALLWGSPKVWNQSDGGALVFLILSYLNFPLNYQWNLLIAFNHLGMALANVWFSTTFIFHAHGGGGFARRLPALPATHVRLAADSGIAPVASGGSDVVHLPDHRLWEPTCAIIDGPARDAPTVIATDGAATVAAFRWGSPGGLTQLWLKNPSRDGFPMLTPPAVFANGLLAIGCSDEELKLIDPATGADLKPWPDLGAPIWGTPASFLRQIYATTIDGDVAMIDSNGVLKKKVNVGGQIKSSPLVTATHVYVSAANGIYAFDLFLNKLHTYASQPAGVSSFAVGADGSTYVVAGDTLHAFAPPS